MNSENNPMRLPPIHSEEFLPPLSHWTTFGGLFLVGMLGAILGLASITQYNPTVKASAIVRPAGEVKIVQAATEGTVQRISVTENQAVVTGEAMVQIDDSRLRTQKTQLEAQIQQCQLELAQINDQIRALESQILATSPWEFSSSAAESNDRRAATSTDLGKTVEMALVQLAATLPEVAQKQSQEWRGLFIKRGDILKDIAQAHQELEQVGVKLENSVVRAPTDGIILKLTLRNPGQRVATGDAIAQIVPSEVPLVLKARVAAQNIGQVAIGQPVQIRISAYPFPDYGILKGTLSSISPDAMLPEIPGHDSDAAYYEVTIQPEQTYLVKGNRQYFIQVGMEGRVDIIAGKETVLTFILRKARLLADL